MPLNINSKKQNKGNNIPLNNILKGLLIFKLNNLLLLN